MKIRYLMLHAYGMGGTIRTVVNQANAMAGAGHDVEIVSVVRRRDKPRLAIHQDVRVSALVDQRQGRQPDSLARKAWRRLRGKIVPRGEFAAEHFTERVEKAVMDYVSALPGGVLVTTRPALNLIAARRAPANVVKVAQEHMNLTAYPDTIRQEIARHYDRFDAVAVLTETNRLEYQQILPDTKIVQIPNAVDRVDQERSTQQNPVVVAAGRLVPQKGFDLLIRAFAQVVAEHPDWRLRVFGSGPRRARLQAQIDELGLGDHVTLMGRTDRLDRELAGASVYALSSRFEGLPMVMIEAMTHGLAVVAFDCPTGPRDVLTDGVDGLLVPPRDVDRLAAALKEVVRDRRRRIELGAAAAAAARGYAPDVVMPMWEELFTELLRGERVTSA